jgi:DNA-binding transcriptional regulator YdaS (Cro superfamily)
MKDRSEILSLVFEKAGYASLLAINLGITRQAVSKWKQVPIRHVPKIMEITGLSREFLRPDIYAY